MRELKTLVYNISLQLSMHRHERVLNFCLIPQMLISTYTMENGCSPNLALSTYLPLKHLSLRMNSNIPGSREDMQTKYVEMNSPLLAMVFVGIAPLSTFASPAPLALEFPQAQLPLQPLEEI